MNIHDVSALDLSKVLDALKWCIFALTDFSLR